ncbi:GGDEF domain-containing protein [Psychromonas arctica]|uniref:GGDEF domain-containing protein n=1 Tax=Psychromonas arctica TaxID=168275 RepID=UPI002FD795F0
MIDNEEYGYRRTTLRVLLIVTIFAASFFAVNNWIAGFNLFAVIEGIVAAFWCVILVIAKSTKHLKRWSFVYLCTFYFLVIYGIMITTFKAGLFSWLFIFPILSYLLLGLKAGTWITFISVSGGLAVLGNMVLVNNHGMHWIVMGNVGFTLATIWSMVYVYESKREYIFNHLREQARKDPLTGLLNVKALNDTLADTLKTAQRHSYPVTLVYIDINDFKLINDKLGHQKGNEILLSVANIITELTRVEDYAFRYGGDEFCIIFPNCVHEQVRQTFGVRLAERVNLSLNQLTMSIGYAQTGPSEFCSPDSLIHKADKNMYIIKSIFKSGDSFNEWKEINEAS